MRKKEWNKRKERKKSEKEEEEGEREEEEERGIEQRKSLLMSEGLEIPW